MGRGARRHDKPGDGIIGAMMEVHRRLGPGFLEHAYQEPLAIEFGVRGIPFRREVPLPIRYRDTILDTVCRVDFVCHESVVVELKAQSALVGVDEAQLIHYLRASGFKVGLVANFGGRSLEWRRFVN
jgi:GxxExxY protein